MAKVKLNKVELKNVKNVGVLVVEKKGVAGTKDDKRTSNPGRPVNKKSARYKRLQKQALYAKVNKLFVSGKKFKINIDKNNTYAYSRSTGKYITSEQGCLVDSIGNHVCNIDYVGRTKVTGYTFVLDKKVNVELNLKQVQFVK